MMPIAIFIICQKACWQNLQLRVSQKLYASYMNPSGILNIYPGNMKNRLESNQNMQFENEVSVGTL